MNVNNCAGAYARTKNDLKLMWISSPVELVGNEVVDERARQAALKSSVFDRPLYSSNFQSLARTALMRAWQAKSDTGRFTHSIIPDVTLWPWFEGQKEERNFELLMIWCVCVCRWLEEIGPLALTLRNIPVGKKSSHWSACRAECEYWDTRSWFVCREV
jgi:hypothetical protein